MRSAVFRATRPATTRFTTVAITAGVLVGALAGCGSSGGPGTSSGPAGSTGAVAPATSVTSSGAMSSGGTVPAAGSPADHATKAAVAKAYRIFFDPSSGIPVSQAYLQHGAMFTAALKAQAKTGAQERLGVRVTRVTMLTAHSATVSFDLLSGGKMLLPNTPGNAVFEAGRWKVAARTFCGLVQLTGKAPATCSDPTVTDLPK